MNVLSAILPEAISRLLPAFGAVAGIFIIVCLFRGYKRVPSNKILVVTGKTRDGKPKWNHGGSLFVWPFIQQHHYLNLEPDMYELCLPDAVTGDGTKASLTVTVTFAISCSSPLAENAIKHFLDRTWSDMVDCAREIVDRTIPAAVEKSTLAQIEDQRGFVRIIARALEPEFNRVGIDLININLKTPAPD